MSKDEKEKGHLPEKTTTTDFPIQEYKLVPIDYKEGVGSEDEIDLIELAKAIWDNRKTVYKFVAVGVVLGVLVALLTPKEYKSSTTLMPEYSSESSSTFGLIEQFGGLVGLSSGSYAGNSNAIRVELYPQIVQSLPFQIELLQTELYFEDYDTTATIYEYFSGIYSPGLFGYLVQYTIGFPGTIIDSFSQNTSEDQVGSRQNTDIINITKAEQEVIYLMRDRVYASLDDESGIISVSVLMPEAKVSAEVTQIVYNMLTEYLIEYRTEKVTIDLNFIEERLNDSRDRFNQSQLKRAEYEDSNQGTLSARASIEKERLLSEYDLAFNVYNTLAQRYEEAKLKVQEETPVFKVLQPVQVPVEKNKPRRALILVLFAVLAAISSIGIIIIQYLFKEWYQK